MALPSRLKKTCSLAHLLRGQHKMYTPCATFTPTFLSSRTTYENILGGCLQRGVFHSRSNSPFSPKETGSEGGRAPVDRARCRRIDHVCVASFERKPGRRINPGLSPDQYIPLPARMYTTTSLPRSRKESRHEIRGTRRHTHAQHQI